MDVRNKSVWGSCVFGSMALAGVLCFSSEARADEPGAAPKADGASAPAPAVAAPAAAPASPDKATAPKKEPDFKHVAITANPLSLILGRIGANVEYVFVPHHGVSVNPFGQFASAEAGGIKTEYSNYGGELGYRFYSGSKGANGFFLGPFVTYMSINTKTSATSGASRAEASASSSVYGAGLDLGGQHVFDFGLTLGAGVGVEYLKADLGSSATSTTVSFSGVLPRFLLTLGYAF